MLRRSHLSSESILGINDLPVAAKHMVISIYQNKPYSGCTYSHGSPPRRPDRRFQIVTISPLSFNGIIKAPCLAPIIITKFLFHKSRNILKLFAVLEAYTSI